MSEFLFVNGYRNPKFKVYSANDVLLFEKVFPECNKDGFKERHEPVQIVKELIDYNHKPKLYGWRIKFRLNYNLWITANTMLKFKDIVDAFANDNTIKIYLTPRSDNADRYFKVYYSGDAIDLGILKGGKNSPGNYGVVIEFTTIGIYKPFQVVSVAEETEPGYQFIDDQY